MGNGQNSALIKSAPFQILFSTPASVFASHQGHRCFFVNFVRGFVQTNDNLTEIYVKFKFDPLTDLCLQIIFIDWQMVKRVFLIIALLALHFHAQPAPIALDFNGFEAAYSQDQKLKLTFRCTGGSGSYSFDFKNVPAEWRISGNTITIQKFSTAIRQNWRFSIYVTDSQSNYLSQNLMLNFMGAYVGLTAVTLPTTGQVTGSYNNFYNPFAIASQVSQPQNQQSGPQSIAAGLSTQSQQPRIVDLVDSYPGINPVDKLASGFGLSNDTSPITTDLISSARATYNPLRDSTSASSPYGAQKDAAIRRQSQANQTIDSLNELIGKLNGNINKLRDDARSAEVDANTSRLAVSECDAEVFKLEDTKAKISNAIKDKELTLSQYNAEVSKQDRLIESEVQKLNSLEDLKKKTEIETLPSSRALQNLQRTLDQCRSNLQKSTKDSEQTRLDIEKTQTEIKMLSIETNEAKAKLDKISEELKSIRDKIGSLEQQLKEARQYEANVLSEKAKYEQVPANNDKKVAALQQKLEGLKSATTVKNSEDCKVYEAPITTVQNILSKDRERYNQVISQLEAQKAVVERAKNNSAELKKTVSSLPVQINTLKKEVSTYQTSIDRANYLCDSKINEYSKYAVSLQSINQKIDSSSSELTRLNGQLAFAQSELASANNALAEVLKAESAYNNNRPAAPVSQQTFSQQSSSSSAPTLQYQIPSTSSTSTSSSSSSFTSTSRNPNISIDEIINSVLKQKTGTSNAQPAPAPVPQPQPSVSTVQQPRYSVASPAQAQSQPQAPAVDASQFSISNFLTRSVDQLSTPGNPVASAPVPTLTPSQNPLASNFDSVIGDEFKTSSKAGFKSAYVFDAKSFLKKANVDMGNVASVQNIYLYTLDDASRRSLLFSGGAQAKLPLLTCSSPSLSDSAVIQDIGLGYILALNNNVLFRLSFSDCTKIVSTYTVNSLKAGTRIYFTGVPVVSLPNNVLLNANLVVCNPETP